MDIVLVPGLWLDGPSWGEVTIRLEAAGHRVRALTLPGLQQAGTEDARTLGDVTLPEQVDAVTRAIDWCADPVLLVGHSAGAGVAWAAADARPDWVARLVL
ncbi:MAG: alpha/beta fold hydrolase, partial [Ilumatobacter sp.]|nr:alpha/beta fold hydrolase [Ilumatobacter sp.]MCB0985197.1 alpha/beta fold hydrolase [Ilumatobacter sp.]